MKKKRQKLKKKKEKKRNERSLNFCEKNFHWTTDRNFEAKEAKGRQKGVKRGERETRGIVCQQIQKI